MRAGVGGGVCWRIGRGVEAGELLFALERDGLGRGVVLLLSSRPSSVYDVFLPAAASLAEVLVGRI